jgi:uncharacterized damage-inducible protein DinB
MMKHYLGDLFHYNNWANRQIIDAIHALPEREERAKLIRLQGIPPPATDYILMPG